MPSLENWYEQLPRPATMVSRYLLAILVTACTLGIYHLVAQPDHPYLIGLFPVIASAILVGVAPAILSLAITAFYIDSVVSPSANNLFVVTFCFEGLLVLWMVRQRVQARNQLRLNLRTRESELTKLRHLHDRLVEASSQRTKSLEQLQESNQIMIKTLERILDKPHPE